MRPALLILTSTLMALLMSPALAATPKTALFAGGCFWCMQPSFDNTPGVIATSVGYTGGEASTAHYDNVTSGQTGHFEAIQVTYDPAKVTYERLLELYWENVDPLDANGQFADKGSQYHPAIFYADEAQHKAAEKSKKEKQTKFDQPIAVQILPAKPFYPAEDYHQKYYQKNSLRYNAYKYGSGRVDRLKALWGEKE